VAFAAIAGINAVKLLFGRKAGALRRCGSFGFVIGLSSSLTGVSGGSVANMIMMLYGKAIHTAIATSAGLGVPIAIVGTIGFMLSSPPHQSLMPPLSIDHVSPVGFAVMTPVSSYVAGFGARLAHKRCRGPPGDRLRAVPGRHGGEVYGCQSAVSHHTNPVEYRIFDMEPNDNVFCRSAQFQSNSGPPAAMVQSTFAAALRGFLARLA
jgi:hypothetical protein